MSTLTELANSQVSASPGQTTPARAFSIHGGRLGRRLAAGYQLLAGLILALFWLRSGLAHITNPYYFLSSVYKYEILGPALGMVAAMGLPALQLTLAAALVTRRFVGGALLLSVALLVVFAAAQASALARNLKIGCGCFGAAESRPLDAESLTIASLLLFCALSALVCWFIAQRRRIVGSESGDWT